MAKRMAPSRIASCGKKDGVLFLAFKKNTVTRLYDRSGWKKWQCGITIR
jgi:hypothetical protein